MTRRPAARAAAALAVALCALATVAAAGAQTTPPAIVLEDGVTAPVFGYTDAIRERLWVTIDHDTDQDGVLDEVAMDIIRPAATAGGLQAPVIMDASPYFTTLCRGNDSQCIADVDGDGLNDRWPLLYDNYFVPRGYAVMLLHMVGTGASTGCVVTGAPTDHLSAVAAIDWLNGRRTARDAAGNTVAAPWHNGKTGMIGKSYDGTLANGAASTGVDGLATIVPISAISTWYLYTRQAGLGLSSWSNNYMSGLSNTVTNPDRRSYCAATRNAMNPIDGDENFDYTPFWSDRDYIKDVDKVKASVFVVHGLQDDNVKANHASEWWEALSARDVPRKMWLTRVGHTEPFDSRRSEWVSTLHRWFDHWLQGVPNGIMGEPRVTVEREAGNVYEESADWPVPGTVEKKLFLRAQPSGPGSLSLSPDTAAPTTSFTDLTSQTETTIIGNPMTVTNNKRVFLSQPLAAPLKFSGTPRIHLRAAANRVGTSLGAVLVDYGAATKVSRSSEGNSTSSATNCWGLGNAIDTGCFRITSKNLTTIASNGQWRVTRGIHDARNRTDLTFPTDLVPGEFYDFEFDLMPEDYVFPAGHRVGVVLVMSYSGLTAANTNYGATLTVDLQRSAIELPLTGGYQAAFQAGIPDTSPPVLELPADFAVEATGPATPVEFAASATDEDPTPLVECAPASGSGLGLGTTTVQCTATDAAGNASSGSFAITVEDTTAPALDLPAGVTVEATAPLTPVAYAAGATDLVDPDPDVVCTPASGSSFPLGATTVDCTATDESGNVSSGSFAVTVVDTTAPALTLPADITVDATMPNGAIVTYAVSASDLADPSPGVFCAPASGSTFAIGTTTVWCTANDASGNFSAGTFDVHVAGVAEQVAVLLAAVEGLPPGSSLAAKVAGIQEQATCQRLRAFSNEVEAQHGKKLPAVQADALLADAARIAAVLGC